MNNSNDDFLNDNITISTVGNDYLTGNVTITVPQPLESLTIDMSQYNFTNSSIGAVGSPYTLNGGTGASTIGTIDITGSSFNWITGTPFEDTFPDWDDFQEMCKEYPGLEKTFEHLKAFYKLCKDDWEAKKKGEND